MVRKSEKQAKAKVQEKAVSKGKGSLAGGLLISLMVIVLMDLGGGLILIPENYSSFRTSHYYFHHGLLPGRKALAQWGTLIYPVQTNSLGFMDSDTRKVPINKDGKRILILGDSHSEGVGVPYPRTFAGILSAELKPHGIEVLNASCISYSPKIEYLKADYLLNGKGLEVDHIFVLIDISDLQNELVYEKFNPVKGKYRSLSVFGSRMSSFLKRNSALYYLSTSIIEQKRQKEFFETASLFADREIDPAENNTYRLYSGFFDHFDDKTLLSNPQFHGVGEWYYKEGFRQLADKGIDLGQENILKLKKLCDGKGIGLTISVHPWHSQILEGKTEDYYVTRWKDFAESNGIGFINLFPLFIDGSNAVSSSGLYYIPEDNHWNELGHSRVAGYLEPTIISALNATVDHE